MAKKIEITWLTDHYDCEDCGGSYAEGASVKIDGIAHPELQFQPVAHCYDGTSFTEEEVMQKVFGFLGYEYETNYG